MSKPSLGAHSHTLRVMTHINGYTCPVRIPNVRRTADPILRASKPKPRKLTVGRTQSSRTQAKISRDQGGLAANGTGLYKSSIYSWLHLVRTMV